MHDLDLILTLAGGLGAALVLGYVTQRLSLSPIVGYLLAGTLVGPHTPGFVADGAMAEQLAEVGVILLMFGVGLQFHVEELLAVKHVAIPGAVAQSAVATALGAAIAHALGWTWSSGIVFGMALAVASTVVLIRILADNRDLHTPTGHIAVGWLVVEDLFTVVALVLLPAVFGAGGSGDGRSIAWAFTITMVKVVALVVFTVVVGNRVIPWLMARVAATRSRELFTLAVLAVALGIAVGSALVFGVSMALGAFLAGLVVGRSEFSLRAASEALPMRDAFAVLFFVSVGMLLNPVALVESPALILATLGVILVGKPLIALALVRVMGYPFRVSLAIAIVLAQIGEFSFILSTVGRELGLLTAEATNALVAASIVSIVLNPLLYRLVDPIARAVSARPWLARIAGPAAAAGGHGEPARRTHVDPRHRAVVVGYGPSGRTVTRLLRENGVDPVVVELNLDTVRELREQAIEAVYGDVTMRETLATAGIAGAGTLVLTSAGMSQSGDVIRIARELNPRVLVLARASYLRERDDLLRAGANAVYTGEGEVALALTEAVLARLGATPDQIDRERVRVRTELFGAA